MSSNTKYVEVYYPRERSMKIILLYNWQMSNAWQGIPGLIFSKEREFGHKYIGGELWHSVKMKTPVIFPAVITFLGLYQTNKLKYICITSQFNEVRPASE